MSDENEQARLEHLRMLQAKKDAYYTVFGALGARSAAQELVVDDLTRFTRFNDSPINRDLQGRTDDSGTLYNLGMQMVVKRIHLMIEGHTHADSSRDDSAAIQ